MERNASETRNSDFWVIYVEIVRCLSPFAFDYALVFMFAISGNILGNFETQRDLLNRVQFTIEVSTVATNYFAIIGRIIESVTILYRSVYGTR